MSTQASALPRFNCRSQALPIDAGRVTAGPGTGTFEFLDAWWMLFCLCVMCESISLVVLWRLVPISAGVGLFLMTAHVKRTDATCMLLFVLLNSGAFLSVIIAHPEDLIFTISRICVTCPFVYLYIAKRGIGRPTLVALALGTCPNLVAYLTGNTFSEYSAYSIGNQFSGISGDPNFLCIYLVTALGSQLILLRSTRSLRSACLWAAAAALSVFLIVISVSRAGAAAAFLSIMIFLLSFRVRSPYLRLAGLLRACGHRFFVHGNDRQMVSRRADRLSLPPLQRRGRFLDHNE